MKKAMINTRVAVKLRKSERPGEWYVYLESYPVFQPGNDKPQRVREYINRIIKTPIWESSSRNRADGSVTKRKPKRDLNGIIRCKSQLDQEVCIYADNLRKLRQREADNVALYSDAEAEQAEQMERSRSSFIEYFGRVKQERHGVESNSKCKIREKH